MQILRAKAQNIKIQVDHLKGTQTQETNSDKSEQSDRGLGDKSVSSEAIQAP